MSDPIVVKTVEELKNAPEEYREAIAKLVISHAVNELYGAQVFDEPAIAYAPTPYAKWLTCRVAMEEYGHHVRFKQLGTQMGIPEDRMMPGVGKRLSQEIVHYVQALRKEDLFKSPGVAETLDWATALSELDSVALDPATVSDTLGVLLKYQDDIARIEGSKAGELLNQVRAELRAAE